MEIEVLSSPTPTQLERSAALRRFNRFYLYTPLLLFTLIVMGLIVFMLIGSIITAETMEMRSFVSAMADIITILALVPFLLLCAIVPAAAIAFAIYRHQEAPEDPPAGLWLQRLLWRLQNILDTIQTKIDPLLIKAANLIIKGNAILRYISWWLRPLTNLLVHKREEKRSNSQN